MAFGPSLGRGGTKHQLPPASPSCVYVTPSFTGKAGEEFKQGTNPDMALTNAKFQDASNLISKARGTYG